MLPASGNANLTRMEASKPSKFYREFRKCIVGCACFPLAAGFVL